ncbi:hypothetical protein NOF04DRAFT_18506 [Fusarium oxysporum II5]|uniref:Uncharacterized protein n=3 Tax=Fusarium oxysporum species complex TaxID=171631 RepID=N1S7K1_FUSC4|nr:uncharacterized protein FOIG_04759 [Fusarium odoratissimum NRRL 54006]EMT73561.1 hypothetical protein FOC4_g10002045 [Fusarium odoratissimum]EXM04547.1 hypothetical protein FOIG_04759 [Fusarium odoratissimum NRRL 54006]KAK2126638.1 hypothetical protein NOF04DRAFT_18506 [Fusarium oxysporum II5]TXB99185.1 hypothetical protein FocTR4_00012479 [Fusarium oxysporum f. sp. cubense]
MCQLRRRRCENNDRPTCIVRTPDLGEAQSVWQQALDDRDLFASRARQARECFELWSPMIRQVIEQPLGVAEHNLATWIWSSDADSDERFKRLNVAREVWLSSSSDPKVICRATKWVQSFIATLHVTTPAPTSRGPYNFHQLPQDYFS